MSIQSTPIAYFGIYFSDFEKLEKFLEENNLEVEDELSADNLGFTFLNGYSGEGYALGYKMTLGETVDKYKKQWNKVLGHLNLNPQPELDIITF